MFGRLLGKRVKDCKRGGALFLVLAICLTLLPVCLFAEEEMLAEWDAETKTLTIANAAKIDADVLAAMEIQTSDGAAVSICGDSKQGGKPGVRGCDGT